MVDISVVLSFLLNGHLEGCSIRNGSKKSSLLQPWEKSLFLRKRAKKWILVPEFGPWIKPDLELGVDSPTGIFIVQDICNHNTCTWKLGWANSRLNHQQVRPVSPESRSEWVPECSFMQPSIPTLGSSWTGLLSCSSMAHLTGWKALGFQWLWLLWRWEDSLC